MNSPTVFNPCHPLLRCLLLAGLLLAVAGCASPGAGQGATAATAPATAATLPLATPVAPSPTPTAMPAGLATPRPTRLGLPTATPAPTPSPLPHTLVLYAALTAVRPNVDPNTYWDPYYGLKTLPALPFLDPAAFDRLYGKRQDSGGDFSMFFFDYRAQPSPDGRAVVVPGLHGYPEYGVAGTGTWLLDLAAGEARQLLPDGVTASWSPGSDAIGYVDGGVLYTLSVAPRATPRALLADENLWSAFAKWSPAGDAIATLISTAPDTSDPDNPRYFAGLWLVPVDGAPPRQLNTLEVYGIEYVSDQLAWSPDGEYVLAMNKVYDLDGNLVSPDYQAAVDWLPEGHQLLRRGAAGIDVITIAGEQLLHIDDSFSYDWAFSHDGRRLAFVRGAQPEGPFTVAVFDLASGERWDVRAGGGSPLRWSGDDSRLVLGIYEAQNGERPQIITVSAAPGGGDERLLLDYAHLNEVMPLK